MSCLGNDHDGEEDGQCIVGDGTICEECGYLKYNIHKSHINPEELNQFLSREITFDDFIHSIISNLENQVVHSSLPLDEIIHNIKNEFYKRQREEY